MADASLSSDRSVLAIDDEPAVLAALVRVLERNRYRITQAASAEAGLELLRTNEYPLILSDNIMPGMKGLEFLAEAMKLSSGSRRILVTGYTDLQQAVDAFNHGIVHRYIQKPWEGAALLAAVDAEWDLYAQSRARLRALTQAEGLLKQRADLIGQALGLLRQAGVAHLVDGEERPPERKLAAILHGDVVGFSRMVGSDHDSTLNTLREHLAAVGVWVARFHGRLVNAVGDSFLAEFPSAVDAVACALDLQREIGRRNAVRPEAGRMRFRMGINVGDVLYNGSDLFGDAVNVAARVQALAAPGGICITDSACRHVRERLPLKIEFLGVHTLKNIAQPVEVYSVIVAPKG